MKSDAESYVAPEKPIMPSCFGSAPINVQLRYYQRLAWHYEGKCREMQTELDQLRATP